MFFVILIDFFSLFFGKDGGGDGPGEQTGTMGGKSLAEVLFVVLDLECKHLTWLKNKGRDWKPKGNCWLCVDDWLTIIDRIS